MVAKNTPNPGGSFRRGEGDFSGGSPAPGRIDNPSHGFGGGRSPSWEIRYLPVAERKASRKKRRVPTCGRPFL